MTLRSRLVLLLAGFTIVSTIVVAGGTFLLNRAVTVDQMIAGAREAMTRQLTKIEPAIGKLNPSAQRPRCPARLPTASSSPATGCELMSWALEYFGQRSPLADADVLVAARVGDKIGSPTLTSVAQWPSRESLIRTETIAPWGRIDYYWLKLQSNHMANAHVPSQTYVVAAWSNVYFDLMVGRPTPPAFVTVPFFWVLYPAAIIALLGAASGAVIFFASRLHDARLAELNALCRRVEAGDLHERAAHIDPHTEYGRLSTHINTMLDRVEETIKTHRDTTDRIAHDLRGPVARAKLRIEELDPSDAETAHREQLAAERDLQGALDAFDSILSLREAAEPRVRKEETFKICDVVDQAIDYIWTTMEPELNIKPVTAGDPSATLDGDPALVLRAVCNLLDNAVRHSPRGGEVRISWRAQVDGVVLTVEDQGKGIGHTERAGVAEVGGRKSGFQLGLAIVRAAMARHGGDFRLENRPGRNGAIARLRFPIRQR